MVAVVGGVRRKRPEGDLTPATWRIHLTGFNPPFLPKNRTQWAPCEIALPLSAIYMLTYSLW